MLIWFIRLWGWMKLGLQNSVYILLNFKSLGDVAEAFFVIDYLELVVFSCEYLSVFFCVIVLSALMILIVAVGSLIVMSNSMVANDLCFDRVIPEEMTSVIG